MPPDRGTVKKTPTVKRESSKDHKPSSTRKDVKDAAKSPKTKQETIKSRDNSVSRSKEKTSKEDKLKISSREKLPSKHRVDSEKMKDIQQNVVKDINKLKESLAKNRTSKDTRSTSKPVATPKRAPGKSSVTSGSGGPLRSQLSYRTPTSRSVSKTPTESTKKINSSSKDHGGKISESKSHSNIKTDNKDPRKLRRVESNSTRKTSKEVQPPLKLSRDRTRTRTLSPREIKIARSIPPQEAPSREKKQTRTKTPERKAVPVPKPDHGDDPSEAFGSLEASESAADYDYEDDFEDYESDFEEDIESELSDEGAGGSEELESDMEINVESDDDGSDNVTELSPRPVVEEEKKMDSGNYDLTESKRKAHHEVSASKRRGQIELDEIKQAVERENSALAARQRLKAQLTAQHTIPKDEGFEEEKTEVSKPAIKEVGFINFSNAKKRMQDQKNTAKAKKRGEELLDMIRLDVVSFSLFELAPMAYDVYMKSYGRSNTAQAHVQTNEDNLSEETQTEEIVMKNKWTQKPVAFHTKSENGSKDKNDPLMVFSQDHLGVGGDSLEDDLNSWKKRMKVNAHRLDQFLFSAGQVMVRLLEAKDRGGSRLTQNDKDVPFSDGYISLRVDLVSFLAGRPVTMVRFPAENASMLLTVHQGVEVNPTEDMDPLLGRCMICIWSFLEPASPQKILLASEEVTAACFEPSRGSLVFAGLQDGSVCMWDLREPSASHHLLRMKSDGWVLRSPTYSTAEILKKEGHLTEVVSLQPLKDAESDSEPSELNELSPMQVCSLEEAGTVIVWTVLQSFELTGIATLAQQDLGLAHWGKVRLVRTTTINLGNTIDLEQHLISSLQCFDLQVDSENSSHLYASTNTGHVIHCLKTGGKPRPRLYRPASESLAIAKCIECCSFGQPYFLVGCEEGSIRLHSRWSDKPLTTLAGTGDGLEQGCGVRAIQCSPNRPGVFFILDSTSRIHIWDLGISDIHPIEIASLNKTITSMQLSPDEGNGKGSEHLALTTECGEVQIHKIKSKFCFQSSVEFKQELEQFLLYTSAL